MNRISYQSSGHSEAKPKNLMRSFFAIANQDDGVFRYTRNDRNSKGNKNDVGFTLIELLVVIAILAILATVIVVIINPGELLKQSRDTDRMADMATMNKTLALLLADQVSVSLGTSTNIYVSVPDSSPTCANLGLPTPPTGYSYACASTSTYRKVDGTGWIPVNLTNLSSGSPLSRLPQDPINTTSTNLFYIYTASSTPGLFEVSTMLESQKYRYGGSLDKASTDGGSSSVYYEQGSNLTTNPINDLGLVGWWKFDEGSGTSASDSSGNNNTGTLTNGPTWQTSSNCKSGGCLSFDGVNDYVDISDTNVLRLNSDFTISLWHEISAPAGTYPGIMYKGDGSLAGTGYIIFSINSYPTYISYKRDGQYITSNSVLILGNWKLITLSYASGIGNWYINGTLNSSVSKAFVTNISTSSLRLGKGDEYFNGLLDDVRIYNRALSAAEVLALYNASK